MSISNPVAPSVRKTWRRYLIGGASMVLFVIAAMMVHVIGEIAALIALPAALLAMWFCVAAFIGLDELAQRAHYVAWFWGGSLGLYTLPILGLIAVPFGFWDGGLAGLSERLWGEATIETGFFTGILVALAPPLIGYVVWWSVFWLRNR
ncbi:MAG: hypothetical protein AB7H66_03805 [Hyphomonadaceae bacterium]